MAGFPMTQHLIANIDVKLDGDRAAVRAMFYNPMGMPNGKSFFCGGWYNHDLVRTADGWKSRRLIEEASWFDRPGRSLTGWARLPSTTRKRETRHGPLRYDDKNVVITGAADRDGSRDHPAVARGGCDTSTRSTSRSVDQPGVTVRADATSVIPASITAAVAQLPASVDVLMNCAGIPGKTRFSDRSRCCKVNFLGLRMLTEAVIPRMPDGGAVVQHRVDRRRQLVQPHRRARRAAGDHRLRRRHRVGRCQHDLIGDGYFFSKEPVQFYTMVRSVTAIKDGVRINSICPGVTDTKIMPDFRQAMGDWRHQHDRRRRHRPPRQPG